MCVKTTHARVVLMLRILATAERAGPRVERQ